MKRVAGFLIGAVLGGCLVFFGQRYHVLRTEDGLTTVPKMSATFRQTYVDVRGFSVSDWMENRSLMAAVLKADKGHLIQQGVADQIRHRMNRLLEGE
jgi:hypothetical protein